MPPWEAYKSEAKARGALAHELYVAVSTPVAAPEALKANLPDHLAYQAQLEADGKLFLAGPLSDESGDLMEGTGQIIYRAESLDEARQLAEADPMHERGIRTFSLRRWLVNEGSFTLSVKLSAQSVSFDR